MSDVNPISAPQSEISSVMDSAGVGIVWISPDGMIRDINKAGLDLLGCDTPEEVIDRPFREYLVDSPVATDLHDAMSQHQNLKDVSIRLRRKDGSIRTVLLNTSTSLNRQESGQVACFLVDVSGRKRSQPEFHAESQLLETLIAASPLPLVVVDMDGVVRLWNPAAERVLGWKADEVLGRPIHLMPPGSQKECEQIRHHVAQGNRYMAEEACRMRKDGSLVQLSVSASPLIIDGTISGIIIIYNDITERKAAEARLAAEHAVTRILAEANSLHEAAPKIVKIICEGQSATTGALWLLDTTRNVLRCAIPEGCASDSAEQIQQFGRESDEYEFANGASLPGRVWTSRAPAWIPDIELDGNFLRKEAARKANLRSALAFPIQTHNEFFGVIEIFLHDRREPDEAIIQMMNAIGSEIGQFIQRKRAEQALRQSESQLRALLDNTPAVIYMMDLENHYVLINDEIEKLKGVSPGESVVGKSVYDIVPREFADVFVANNQKVLETKRQLQFEEVAPLQDGVHTFLTIKAPLISNGMPYGICGISMDITDRKCVEEKLARQAGELARSNAELEQFGHIVSHDLRAPLLSIDGCAQILAAEYGEALDESAHELIKHIRAEIHSMGRLIKGLLTYSRAGSAPIKIAAASPEKVIAQVLQVLKPSIDSTGAMITHDPLPEVAVDESHLLQLFQNLIENSIKYRGPENPRIHIHGEDAGPDIHFSISDNGIGISSENIEHIFDVFQRASTDSPREGSGVGLAICKKIVERYGRRIWVESQPNAGATFHFTLPKAAG